MPISQNAVNKITGNTSCVSKKVIKQQKKTNHSSILKRGDFRWGLMQDMQDTKGNQQVPMGWKEKPVL